MSASNTCPNCDNHLPLTPSFCGQCGCRAESSFVDSMEIMLEIAKIARIVIQLTDKRTRIKNGRKKRNVIEEMTEEVGRCSPTWHQIEIERGNMFCTNCGTEIKPRKK